ncbi:MAG: NAD(P)/FAD-dependent oxidoreductase [Bacteroidota bacterium]
MTSQTILIIGSGVMGASVAYHLALRGYRNVTVLEREPSSGLGSTGKATGGFRSQFGTEVNVRLSLLARQKLLNFKEELGVDPGYRQCGYLLLTNNESQLKELRAAQQIQHIAGLHEASEVSIDDALKLNPAINPKGLIGGVFCPTDGFIRPLEILRGYTEASKRLGVRFLYGEEVTGFEMGDERKIVAVKTKSGELAADVFINAAGAWAGTLARMADVNLPVVPLRRQVAVTHSFTRLPEDMPMTIFCEDGFHLRVRDGRVLLLMPSDRYPAQPFDFSFASGWVDQVVERARQCIPVLRDAKIDTEQCHAGLYEMSPDKHAILGHSAEVENFYLINGSSGHGVMHAPALGQLLAEILVDGQTTSLDVSALRHKRFRENKLNLVMEFL